MVFATVWNGLKRFEMVPDACECFRDSPDAGWCDFRKFPQTRKLLVLRENCFRSNDVFMTVERQTAKTEMTARTTRRYHVFIKISFCDGICQSISCLSRKSGFSFSCTADSFYHEIMFWLEGAEVKGSHFKQKNYRSAMGAMPYEAHLDKKKTITNAESKPFFFEIQKTALIG